MIMNDGNGDYRTTKKGRPGLIWKDRLRVDIDQRDGRGSSN